MVGVFDVRQKLEKLNEFSAARFFEKAKTTKLTLFTDLRLSYLPDYDVIDAVHLQNFSGHFFNMFSTENKKKQQPWSVLRLFPND